MRLLVIAAALTVVNGQSAMEEECRREITSPVFTNATLRDAVARFFQDKGTAESTYGPMKCWDVSEVTDMEGLFNERVDMSVTERTAQQAFNEPIEFWVVDKGHVQVHHEIPPAAAGLGSAARHEHGGHVRASRKFQPGPGLVPAFKCGPHRGVPKHAVRGDKLWRGHAGVWYW